MRVYARDGAVDWLTSIGDDPKWANYPPQIMGQIPQALRYQPIGFELLPKKFTLSQLQHLYELVLERLPATFSALIESGQLAPIVGRTFPLSEVPAAMKCHEDTRLPGRILITP